ncbi:MAG TPA: ABC transporter permease [Symbiobacteriaceae bacterium]|nr:ABC transporter permease [Symbiobacteriaceae bacterium]
MDRRLSGAIREITVPVLAILAGFLVGTVFIIFAGKNPMEAYKFFNLYVWGDLSKLGETLVSTTPLICTGLAIALAFRCGLFNIGAEGQYLVGQIATAWAGFFFTMPGWLPPAVAGFIHPLFAIFIGMLAAGLYAAIPGVLKAYRGVHEVINSIMLNYTALFFIHWLLLNKMRDPGSGTAATPRIQPTADFVQGLIQGSRLHVGLFVALIAAFVVWVFLWKTAAGYEIRAVGFAPGAAEYAGISVKKNIVLAMLLSGALIGLAAAIQTLGLSRKFYEPMGFTGFGFDGIAVALVGRNHPLGVVLAAFLFGALDRGGQGMQAGADVPKTVMWVVQGTVIFFVAAEGLWRFLQTRRTKKEVKTA